MAYLVNITARAEHDFASLYQEIDAVHSLTALKWYKGLKEAILSLEKLPHRCPITHRKGLLRHLLYDRKPNVYRVIYRIVEKQKQVEILHIRHDARAKFSLSDLR